MNKALQAAIREFKDKPVIVIDEKARDILANLYEKGVDNYIEFEKLPYEQFSLILDSGDEEQELAYILKVNTIQDIQVFNFISVKNKNSLLFLGDIKLINNQFAIKPNFSVTSEAAMVQAILDLAGELAAYLIMIIDLIEMEPTVIIKQKAERKFLSSKTLRRDIPEHFKLNLTERKSYKYSEKSDNAEKRKSPRMHIRRAHFKSVHTSNGIIRKLIKQTIVCKDNEPISNAKLLR